MIDAKTLEGTWSLVSWSRRDMDEGSVSYPFGKSPVGTLSVSGDHFMIMVTKDIHTMHSVPTLDDNFSKPDMTEYTITGTCEINDKSLMMTYKECTEAHKVGETKTVELWFDGHETLVFKGTQAIEVNGNRYMPAATWIKNI